MRCADDDTNGSADPSTWDACSYTDDPVDRLEPEEPLEPSAFREASLAFLRIVSCIDSFMLSSPDFKRSWLQVSIALGLPSTRGQSEYAVANIFRYHPTVFARGVSAFLRLARIEPAFGLKSTKSRIGYQRSWRNGNGHSNGSNAGYLKPLHDLYSEKGIESLIRTDDFGSWNEMELLNAVAELEPLVTVRERMQAELKSRG
jgi:hypothetical protein